MKVWFDVNTPAGARRATRIGVLGCIWIVGGTLVAVLLNDWKLVDLGISADASIVFALCYGFLGWAIYRGYKAITVIGVVLHLALTVFTIYSTVASGEKLRFAWADYLQTLMLIQGARGVTRYRRLVSLPVPKLNAPAPSNVTPNAESVVSNEGNVSDNGITGTSASALKFCPMCGQKRETATFCASAAKIFGRLPRRRTKACTRLLAALEHCSRLTMNPERSPDHGREPARLDGRRYVNGPQHLTA